MNSTVEQSDTDKAESLVEILSQYTCERYRVVRGNSQEPAKAVKL